MLTRHAGACTAQVLLFTATMMIGNERVELMLFDTTGQVIIVALGSFSSNHSSSAATSVNAYAAAHDLAHFHRESFRPSFEARLLLLPFLQRSSWNQLPLSLPQSSINFLRRISAGGGQDWRPHTARDSRQRRGVPRQLGRSARRPHVTSRCVMCHCCPASRVLHGNSPPVTSTHQCGEVGNSFDISHVTTR